MGERISVNAETALRVLDEIVAEYGPDYRYTKRGGSCFYWHKDEDRPGCIIGVALHKLGVGKHDLICLDNISVGAVATELYPVMAMSREALQIFRVAQAEQDYGAAWGDAVNLARTRHEAGQPETEVA